ncbi:hypothetical protein LPB86_03825 [Pedobacter sp. MC2016-14]|uniref:hypothetical protein n=1 Tax=Pedobacter sp. MC2016-14 TaxID=2897327 RepID=UPI001E5693C4|nr:hypothetical protein [Pedobacter sp. MC2016-14]MCD0487343.1 hypothetical protein [Pedobacter sp. MC2016-14]
MLKISVNYALLFFLICLGIFSCREKSITKADLVRYINNPENGFTKSVSLHSMQIGVTNQPWQLIARNRLKKKTSTGNPVSLKDFSSKYFFILSLSNQGREALRNLSFNSYSEIVQVMSFRMSKYISAQPDNLKPVEPLECLFQPTYGMANSNNILLVFDKKSFAECKRLKITISEFGLNIGNQNFDFNFNDLDYYSTLNYAQLL